MQPLPSSLSTSKRSRDDDVLRITEDELASVQPFAEPRLPRPPEAGRQCPMCGHVSARTARLCSGCGEAFTPMDDHFDRAEATRRRMLALQRVPTARQVSIILFCLSVFGVLSPLVFPCSLAVAIIWHRALGLAGGLYRVLAYSAAVISLVYLVIGVILWQQAT